MLHGNHLPSIHVVVNLSHLEMTGGLPEDARCVLIKLGLCHFTKGSVTDFGNHGLGDARSIPTDPDHMSISHGHVNCPLSD